MDTRTAGQIITGKLVGRGIKEISPMIDQAMPQGIMGQSTSRVARIAFGVGGLYLSLQGRISPDLDMVVGVAAIDVLVDEIVDIVKGMMVTPSAAMFTFTPEITATPKEEKLIAVD